MTNGEKIQTILNVDRDCTEVHGENGTMTFTVKQEWWNTEYKEPTQSPIIDWNNCHTEEQLKSISTTKSETLISLNVYKQVAKERDIAIEQLHELGYEFGQKIEPTTKNDLALIHTEGLDEGVRCAMCTNSMKSDRGCDGGCVVNNAMYKEVMDVIENHIQPTSVTPIRPKGHWIECMPGGAEEWCYKCSECNFWKYKKTINLSKFSFCPNCGSDNREVEG